MKIPTRCNVCGHKPPLKNVRSTQFTNGSIDQSEELWCPMHGKTGHMVYFDLKRVKDKEAM